MAPGIRLLDIFDDHPFEIRLDAGHHARDVIRRASIEALRFSLADQTGQRKCENGNRMNVVRQHAQLVQQWPERLQRFDHAGLTVAAPGSSSTPIRPT